MTKIVVGDLHKKLSDAGVPIDGVALDRPGKPGVSIDFHVDATEEQKAVAAQIVKNYDQDVMEAEKVQPVTETEINSAKSIPDLKALMIRQYRAKG